MSNRFFYIVLFSALLIGVSNLFIDVMEIDAAQYAEMSWEMMQSENYLEPTCLGRPYLDKPPLLFWLSSFSFLAFGVSNFAYKLPSLLFAFLAVYSVYRFSKVYYDESIARYAALFLATSQAIFMATNDVRTDTILMGAVIFSIWQWAEFSESGRMQNLLLGSVGLALALLAKGPIGIVAVSAAFVPHLLWKKKWRLFFDLRLLIGIIIVAGFLLPMSVGLYRQHGVAGLRFYYWTQSFGRITGESEWNNHPDTFFLLHTFAWMILPWTIFFAAGWVKAVSAVIKMQFVSWSQKEFVSISGFTLVLLSLMLSKYQLPHYVYVVLPLGCVIAAKNFNELQRDTKLHTWIYRLQMLVSIAALLGAVLLNYCFSGNSLISLIALLLAAGVSSVILYKRSTLWHYAAVPIIAFNLLLSIFYFPAILKYQASNEFGKYIHSHFAKNFSTFKYINNYSLVFYAQQMPANEIWETADLKVLLAEKKNLWIVTTQEGVDVLRQNNIQNKILLERDNYMVSKMNLSFLNPLTRNNAVQKNYLVEVYD